MNTIAVTLLLLFLFLPVAMFIAWRQTDRLAEHTTFSGFTVPTRVEAGNQFGTTEYVPFFKVQVDDLRFPKPP